MTRTASVFVRLLFTAVAFVTIGSASGGAAPSAAGPAAASSVQAPPQASELGTVELPRAVLADGQRLAAGTYGVRLTGELATDVVGQEPSSERWVEFVRNGKTMGRELASFVESSDVEAVTPRGSVPAQGSSRVQALRGAEYLRIWFNDGGDQVLIYLPWADGAMAGPSVPANSPR